MPEPTEAMGRAVFEVMRRDSKRWQGLTWVELTDFEQGWMLDMAGAALAASPSCRSAELAEALTDAADALHDCVWLLRDQPKPTVGLPTPTSLVLAGAIEAENVARVALAAHRASGEAGPEKEQRADV